MQNSQPFIDAIIQAATTRANLGASPAQTVQNAGQIANLQNLAQIRNTAANTGAAGQALAGNASNNADQAEMARKAAQQEQMLNLEQQAKVQKRDAEVQNPANFQAVINDAGGKTFLDGNGKPISVNDYARAKNITIADALKDSQDPADIDFVNDYKDTMQLGQIMATGNKKELDKFYEDRPGLETFVKDNDIKTWDQYVQKFRSAYTDRFSQAQADTTARRPVSDLSIRR